LIGFIISIKDVFDEEFEENFREAFEKDDFSKVIAYPKNPKLFYLACGSLVGTYVMIENLFKKDEE
jgi:hypothetical protein